VFVSTAVLAKGAQKTWRSVRRPPLEALTTLFRNQPLVPLLLAAAAAVAVVVALLLWAREPEYRVLFSGLGEADGGQIISELDKRAIPYRLSEGGNTILVPGDKMNALRLQLAEQGLPKGGRSVSSCWTSRPSASASLPNTSITSAAWKANWRGPSSPWGRWPRRGCIW
jgi:flagellar M-ring protein FliF